MSTPYVSSSITPTGPQDASQVNIQMAVYQALTHISDMPPVYDDVPQNAAFPYIVIGDDTSIAFDDDCGTGFESTITLHVWSIYSGRKEVKDIMGAIYTCLHRQKLNITGGYAVTMNFEYQDTLLDPDGVTRHGIIRFRLLTRSI